YRMGGDDVILTVATDGAKMYGSEREKAEARYFSGRFDEVAAAETFGEHVLGTGTDHLLELSTRDRERIFNLGYFTWVEQRSVGLEEFRARTSQDFWRGLREIVPVWDSLIEEFNAATGAGRR